MSPLTLSWLMSQEGTIRLADAARLPDDPLTRLTHLRRLTSPEYAAAAVELLELRRRARSRFPEADAMFFTAEGLEQATAASVARYRASRFPAGIPILDACCGIGGDAGALAQRASVLAVDRQQAALLCTRKNAEVCASPYPVHTLCADVTALDFAHLAERGIGAALFDPSRRADRADGSRRRVRDASDYTPPLDFLQTLRSHFPALCVKVSPGIDDETLQQYDAQVEFLSDRGECKEAALWFGPLQDSLCAASSVNRSGENYRATLLRPDSDPITLEPFLCDFPALSAPLAWLYEPDPAVIRAHLVPQIASLLRACQITPDVAYLTANDLHSTPFATAYRVLDWLPYQEKAVRARLRQLGRRVEVVKKRNVPLEPELVRKALLSKDLTLPPCVLILMRYQQKIIVLLCEKPAAV